MHVFGFGTRSIDVDDLISKAALKLPNHCRRKRTFPHQPMIPANISQWADYAMYARTNPTTFPERRQDTLQTSRVESVRADTAPDTNAAHTTKPPSQSEKSRR